MGLTCLIYLNLKAKLLFTLSLSFWYIIYINKEIYNPINKILEHDNIEKDIYQIQDQSLQDSTQKKQSSIVLPNGFVIDIRSFFYISDKKKPKKMFFSPE